MDEDPSKGPEALGLETCSGDEAEVMEIDEPPASKNWREPILRWIDRGRLPSDHTEARRIARRAKSFIVIDGELYKRIPLGVLQRCIPILEGRELIRDIHAGI